MTASIVASAALAKYLFHAASSTAAEIVREWVSMLLRVLGFTVVLWAAAAFALAITAVISVRMRWRRQLRRQQHLEALWWARYGNRCVLHTLEKQRRLICTLVSSSSRSSSGSSSTSDYHNNSSSRNDSNSNYGNNTTRALGGSAEDNIENSHSSNGPYDTAISSTSSSSTSSSNSSSSSGQQGGGGYEVKLSTYGSGGSSSSNSSSTYGDINTQRFRVGGRATAQAQALLPPPSPHEVCVSDHGIRPTLSACVTNAAGDHADDELTTADSGPRRRRRQGGDITTRGRTGGSGSTCGGNNNNSRNSAVLCPGISSNNAAVSSGGRGDRNSSRSVSPAAAAAPACTAAAVAAVQRAAAAVSAVSGISGEVERAVAMNQATAAVASATAALAGAAALSDCSQLPSERRWTSLFESHLCNCYEFPPPSVYIFVLGDFARSPRMLYHTQALVTANNAVAAPLPSLQTLRAPAATTSTTSTTTTTTSAKATASTTTTATTGTTATSSYAAPSNINVHPTTCPVVSGSAALTAGLTRDSRAAARTPPRPPPPPGTDAAAPSNASGRRPVTAAAAAPATRAVLPPGATAPIAAQDREQERRAGSFAITSDVDTAATDVPLERRRIRAAAADALPPPVVHVFTYVDTPLPEWLGTETPLLLVHPLPKFPLQFCCDSIAGRGKRHRGVSYLLLMLFLPLKLVFNAAALATAMLLALRDPRRRNKTTSPRGNPFFPSFSSFSSVVQSASASFERLVEQQIQQRQQHMQHHHQQLQQKQEQHPQLQQPFIKPRQTKDKGRRANWLHHQQEEQQEQEQEQKEVTPDLLEFLRERPVNPYEFLPVVLVQSPPALPLLLVCGSLCKLLHARFVVDWHNIGYTLLFGAAGGGVAVESTIGARALRGRRSENHIIAEDDIDTGSILQDTRSAETYSDPLRHVVWLQRALELAYCAVVKITALLAAVVMVLLPHHMQAFFSHSIHCLRNREWWHRRGYSSVNDGNNYSRNRRQSNNDARTTAEERQAEALRSSYRHSITRELEETNGWLFHLQQGVRNVAAAAEGVGGRLADANLCVSVAMQQQLLRQWGIAASVLYDRPASAFRPINLAERHVMAMKYMRLPTFTSRDFDREYEDGEDDGAAGEEAMLREWEHYMALSDRRQLPPPPSPPVQEEQQNEQEHRLLYIGRSKSRATAGPATQPGEGGGGSRTVLRNGRRDDGEMGQQRQVLLSSTTEDGRAATAEYMYVRHEDQQQQDDDEDIEEYERLREEQDFIPFVEDIDCRGTGAVPASVGASELLLPLHPHTEDLAIPAVPLEPPQLRSSRRRQQGQQQQQEQQQGQRERMRNTHTDVKEEQRRLQRLLMLLLPATHLQSCCSFAAAAAADVPLFSPSAARQHHQQRQQQQHTSNNSSNNDSSSNNSSRALGTPPLLQSHTPRLRREVSLVSKAELINVHHRRTHEQRRERGIIAAEDSLDTHRSIDRDTPEEAQEAHGQKELQQLRVRVSVRSNRPAILLAATSWTADEDMEMLLHALQLYDSRREWQQRILRQRQRRSNFTSLYRADLFSRSNSSSSTSKSSSSNSSSSSRKSHSSSSSSSSSSSGRRKSNSSSSSNSIDNSIGSSSGSHESSSSFLGTADFEGEGDENNTVETAVEQQSILDREGSSSSSSSSSTKNTARTLCDESSDDGKQLEQRNASVFSNDNPVSATDSLIASWRAAAAAADAAAVLEAIAAADAAAAAAKAAAAGLDFPDMNLNRSLSSSSSRSSEFGTANNRYTDKSELLPPLLLLVSGRGPRKNEWLQKAAAARLRHVAIRTLFAPLQDYYKLQQLLQGFPHSFDAAVEQLETRRREAVRRERSTASSHKNTVSNEGTGPQSYLQLLQQHEERLHIELGHDAADYGNAVQSRGATAEGHMAVEHRQQQHSTQTRKERRPTPHNLRRPHYKHDSLLFQMREAAESRRSNTFYEEWRRVAYPVIMQQQYPDTYAQPGA